jgi:hypothetical protein
MAKTRKQLSEEELDEFELRAYALLNRRGVRDTNSKTRWRRYALIYETPYLQLASQGHQIVVRVCDRRPRVDGLMLYEQAWRKDKAANTIEHVYDKAKVALQHMRDLMILDDLASL